MDVCGMGEPRRSQYHDILRALAEPPAADGPAALATVVHIDGSAYRREGAQMLLWADGRRLGLLSGGCLEDDVALQAPRVWEGGGPLLLTYDLRSDGDDVWGLGIGCNGAVDVFVEALGPEHPWRFAARWLLDGLRVASALVLTGADAGRWLCRADDGRSAGSLPATFESLVPPLGRPSLAGDVRVDDDVRIYREARRPPSVVALFGATDDVLPVARQAAEVGLRVLVVDHRPALTTRERFPTVEAFHRLRPEDLAAGLDGVHFDAAVVMTHDLTRDAAIVRFLAGRALRYAGLLGPWARTERVLRTAGAAPEPLYAPVGLDLGAESPEEIACSVVAEILAVMRGRPAGHLAGNRAALHRRSTPAPS